VTWASRLQTEVALSSTEAEYNALSESLRSVLHLMQLVDEAKSLKWDVFMGKPTVHCKVFEDNAAVVEMCRLPKMRPRTKHLCVRLHHFREHVRKGRISITHVPTKDQLADIATKPQPEELFTAQRDTLLQWAKEDKVPTSTTIQLMACEISSTNDADGVVPVKGDSETRSQHCSTSPGFLQLDVYPTAGTTEATTVPKALSRLIAKYQQSHRGRAGLQGVKPTTNQKAAGSPTKGPTHGTKYPQTSLSMDSGSTQGKSNQSAKGTSQGTNPHSKRAAKSKSS
jgi:hypothetical protein